jgi:hypothetical protein
MRKTVLLFLVLLMCGSVKGQGEFSGSVIEPGYMLVTTLFTFDGINYKGNKNNAEGNYKGNYRDYYIPTLSVDVGILSWLQAGFDVSYRITKGAGEVNFATTNKSNQLKGNINGFDALSLRGLTAISEEGDYLPTISSEATFYVPHTGANGYKIENPGFFNKFYFLKSFGDNSEIYSFLEGGWDGYWEYPVFSANFCPGYYVSDAVFIYAEYTGVYTNKYMPDHMIDVGTTVEFGDLFSGDAYLGSSFLKNGKRLYGGLTLYFYFGAF